MLLQKANFEITAVPTKFSLQLMQITENMRYKFSSIHNSKPIFIALQ